MPLPSQAHVTIGGSQFFLDESYDSIVGPRRCYIHGGRSIFAGRTDITGKPGSQNLKSDYLVWSLTQFNGEGQVVLNNGDPDSANLFYRSEGIDFRTAGQGKLNKSVISETVSVAAGANTTIEGNADFTDITGSSTASGTDRKLNVVGDKIGASANYTPGATTIQADFYLYRDSWATTATTVQGSAFFDWLGHGNVTGSDIKIGLGEAVQSAKKSTGTHFTAGNVQRVEFYASSSSTELGLTLRCSIIDVTNGDNTLIATTLVGIDSTTTLAAALVFTPKANHDYRFRTFVADARSWLVASFSSPAVAVIDKVLFGNTMTETVAVIEIWNQTAGASVTTKTVTVTAEAAGSLVGSITFPAVAATNYRARIKRSSGKQNLWADKVVQKPLANAVYNLDCVDFGFGQYVWMGARSAAVDSRPFRYNTSTDAWDNPNGVSFNDGAATTGAITLAMAHSDSREYFLLDTNEVYTTAGAAADDDRYAYFSANAKTLVGMTVCQNRLWLIAEDGTAGGVNVYSLPLDDTSINPWNLNSAALSAGVRTLNIPAGSKTPDKTLRQRMCSAPTGTRFFVNYADVTAKVFEVDGSGTTLEPRELADLGHGVKATCIAYEGGVTFIGAQYYGDATASDTDKQPRSALFAIDQNGVLQRIGFFRRDNPDVRPPQFIVPYQTNLYIQQGIYLWRYSLVDGGLFCEYQLEPVSAGNQRALAVILGRIFACYTDEVFVAGSVGTYRQSSVSGGSTHTSSIFDLGLPATKKSLTKIELLCDTLPSNTSVSVEYQTDQSGTWVLAGTLASGSRTTFYITETTFLTLQVRTTLTSIDGVSTPIWHATTVWSSAAEDEEFFELMLLAEDADSSFHIDGEQPSGQSKISFLMDLWRRKAVTTFTDGYPAAMNSQGEDYLVTIEDVSAELIKVGEGRVAVTLKVVR